MSSNQQTQEIMRVGPALAIEAIKVGYRAQRPTMLWGQPGVGKSSLVAQAAEQLGKELNDPNFGFIDLRLVQIESVDLRGLPHLIEKDGRKVMGHAPSGFLPRVGNGILFLDELPQAPIPVQNAASELLLDRRVGEYDLPPGWGIVAAGNRRSDRAGTNEIPAHLKNRLVHMEVEIPIKEWITWAEHKKIHPDVIAFLKQSPDSLNEFNPDKVACPTARTWEFVSDLLKQNPSDAAMKVLVSGAVGKAMMAALTAWMELNKSMATYEDIIADPMNAPLPDGESMKHRIGGMVAERAENKDLDAIVKYFGRLKEEWVRSYMLQMYSRDKTFKENPAFKKMYDAHYPPSKPKK